MRRVFALLLTLLAMLPAIAAADIPNQLTNFNDDRVTFQSIRGQGSCRLAVEGTHDGHPYKAYYYFSGAMDTYTYTFDCGCEVTFEPSGSFVSARRDIVGKGTYSWNETENAWVKYAGDEEIVDRYAPDAGNHAFAAGDHQAPVTYTAIDGKRPPLNAADAVAAYATYAELKNAALNTFAANLADEDGEKMPRVSSSAGAFVRKNGMYAHYRDGKLFEVYVGPIVFHTFYENVCRLYGDAAYGVTTEGHYDWETGELFEYGFYTADKSMKAMYSVKNVLLSYEAWDTSRGYWGFFDDEWYYSASGDAFNTVKTTPPAEILEKILHAPAPAEYESACVTSESQLADDEKGVPYIIASKSDINHATVQTISEQTGERTTEFNISLMQGNTEVELNKPVTLTLGYPAGMPQAVSEDYEFVIRHTTDDGEVEILSTLSDNVELTTNGPQITATSFSPYEVIWGTAEEMKKLIPENTPEPGSIAGDTSALPKTGDDSQLILFAALLAVCAGGLMLVAKRRAKQQ